MSCLKIMFKAIETYFMFMKATEAVGDPFSPWTHSRRGVLFKHEWTSDSREDNTRRLKITTEYNYSVMGLKSPSGGVILDLMKSMYRLPALVLIATPSFFVLVGLVSCGIPHWDLDWLQVIQFTSCVSETITANFKTAFSTFWILLVLLFAFFAVLSSVICDL